MPIIKSNINTINENWIIDAAKGDKFKFKESDFSSPSAVERTIEKIQKSSGKPIEFIEMAVAKFLLSAIPYAIAGVTLAAVMTAPIAVGVVMGGLLSLIYSISSSIGETGKKHHLETLKGKMLDTSVELGEISEKWCYSKRYYKGKELEGINAGDELPPKLAEVAKKYGVYWLKDVDDKKVADIRKARTELHKGIIIIDKALRGETIKAIHTESFDIMSEEIDLYVI